jgi:hypothetical protein
MPLGGSSSLLFLRTAGACLLGLAFASCRPSVDVVSLSQAEQELTYIAMGYSDAHSQLGHGPKDAEELKPFLKAFGDPEDLLVSPNDKQPYVIVWNVNPIGGPTPYQQMFPILAYEKEGVGGKRAITDVRGRPMTIPDEDLTKLTFVGRHKPATN